MCTLMFTTITLQIKDEAGRPVKLDDAYTVRVETGEKIRSTSQGMGEGYYVVLDDSYQKKLAKTTANFKFIGIKNGKEVVNEPFTISADCCHVAKQSGKEEIIIR